MDAVEGLMMLEALGSNSQDGNRVLFPLSLTPAKSNFLAVTLRVLPVFIHILYKSLGIDNRFIIH